MGVIDGANAMEWEKVITGLCLPPKVEAIEVRRIFLDYLEFKKSLLQMPAGLLVVDALKQAWPCSSKEP